MDTAYKAHWGSHTMQPAPAVLLLRNSGNSSRPAAAMLCVMQVYPIVVHWMWTKWGWLSPNNIKPLFGSGAMDFAGV
jgi:hypothetical protein